jgi:hypothetical protein
MSKLENLKKLQQDILSDLLDPFEQDRAIGLEIGGWSLLKEDHPLSISYANVSFLRDGNGNIFGNGAGACYDDCYTESIEAAIRLQEYALPGWYGYFSTVAEARIVDPNSGNDFCAAHADGPAIALVLSIIQALIWLEETKIPKLAEILPNSVFFDVTQSMIKAPPPQEQAE